MPRLAVCGIVRKLGSPAPSSTRRERWRSLVSSLPWSGHGELSCDRQRRTSSSSLARVAKYLEASKAGFDYITDEQAGTVDVVLRAECEPPMVLGAIVGDVLHNLRSALAAIAWETCMRSGAGLTEKQERDIYFPLTWEPEKWPDAAKRLIGVPAAQVQAFEYVQPWYFDEQVRKSGFDIPREFAQNEPLWQLHEMAKVDRHRTPHPLLARAGGTWLGTPEGGETALAAVDPPPWKPGKTILRWTVHPAKKVRQASPACQAILTLPSMTGFRRHRRCTRWSELFR